MQAGQVGIGFRRELAADLLAHREAVDFVEVVAESCYVDDDARREVLALRDVWPVALHGVKLSLGSAAGFDEERAAKLGALARALSAPIVSEHVALTHAGGREIGHLTALPSTRETVRVVARNVEATRRHLPDVPFLLENVARTVAFADDALSEGEFCAEIAEATGAPLLLDVANLYANARNAGLDPLAELGRFPLERVAMIHVAGGLLDGGFYYDTHAHALPEDVLVLTAAVLAHTDAPVLIERDDRFPPFAELAAELASLRDLPRGRGRPALPRPPSVIDDRPATELAARQSALAAALVDDAAALLEGVVGIERTRAVLLGKRVDDALPLLPRLALRRAEVEPLVRERVGGWPRPRERVGIADALRIGEACREVPALADDAARDLLVLRARFVGPDADGEVHPRRGPYVGRVALGGRSQWVMKGLGSRAPVRILSSRGQTR
ncbi:MAG: DUF692 domain-containing protein [Myxococcales bacterium]|nr:DUF692 domain-containing protein [Myxococcales bacterium]